MTAEQIARSLTDAQRRAVLLLDRNWKFLPLKKRPNKTHPIIERWSSPHGGFQYRLTPLGLQVRQVLQEQPK